MTAPSAEMAQRELQQNEDRLRALAEAIQRGQTEMAQLRLRNAYLKGVYEGRTHDVPDTEFFDYGHVEGAPEEGVVVAEGTNGA